MPTGRRWPQKMHVVEGQLTFRRALSKKLVFYDLLTSEQGGEQSWVEVVVKLGTYGSTDDVKDLTYRLKLGDIVRVEGHAASSHEVQATAVTMLQAWRDRRPGEGFKPHPSPLHTATQQARQAQQHQNQQPALGGSAEQRQSGGSQAVAPGSLEGAAAAAPAAAAAKGEAPGQQQGAVCKYFVNSGRCAKGDSCPFAHVRSAALQRQWVTDMLSERQVLSSWQGFAHSGGAAAKSRRAQVLAAWLVETYGLEALNAGEGVLDVAGGAGGMTFELAHVHGIRCTLVDPRPFRLNKQQQRHLQAVGRPAAVHTLTAEQLQDQHQGSSSGLPGQAAAAAASAAAGAGAGAGADSAGARDSNSNVAAAGLDSALALHQVQAWFGPELWRSAGWRRRFARGFSLVLACHPDQATDPALDYALEAQLAFAIVPCCVFPRLFPHRRLLQPSSSGGGGDGDNSGSNGGGSTSSGAQAEQGVPPQQQQKQQPPEQQQRQQEQQQQQPPEQEQQAVQGVPVLTYPQLVEYLAARGQAQQVVLGFQGANIVVYRQRQQQQQASV